MNIYNPEYVKILFDKMSTSYEKMNFITSFGFSYFWRKQFINKVNFDDKNIKIIDLMTGMGETWSITLQRFPNAKLTALDFSVGMLKFAHFKNEKYFKNQIKIINQDILNNQLKDNSFDLITCAFGLKTLNEDQISILAKETKRILKDKGKFTFIEVSTPSNTILKYLYGFYLGIIIPFFGKLFLKNPNEYKMLWTYTNKFVNAKNTEEIFRKSGLNVKYESYFFGCASGIYGYIKK